MQKNSAEIEALRAYYQEPGITIIGMNDSQGVNLLSSPFSKGFLKQIKDTLETPTFTPKLIDCFSTIINKTEHIDYMLSSYLTEEEIKLSQAYGVQVASEHVVYNQLQRVRKPIERIAGRPIKLFDSHPNLGIIGKASQLIYRVNPGDEKTTITRALQETKEPTLVFSSGNNNSMREIHNNPYSLPIDYEERELTGNYYYSLAKAKNPDSLKRTMKGIERNFNHILTINPNTDIYVLGTYCPKRLYKTGLEEFRKMIIEYNEFLEYLCNLYGQSFIDIEPVAQASLNQTRVHLPEEAACSVADLIMMKMYERKIGKSQPPARVTPCFIEEEQNDKSGAEQMIEFIQRDIEEDQEQKRDLDSQFETIKDNIEEFNFPLKSRELQEFEMPSIVKGEEIEEHKREEKVFQLVQSQTSRNKV